MLTFESVDEILKCDHSNKSFEHDFPVVLCIMLYKVVLTFDSVYEILTSLERLCSDESYRTVLSRVLFVILTLWMKS